MPIFLNMICTTVVSTMIYQTIICKHYLLLNTYNLILASLKYACLNA